MALPASGTTDTSRASGSSCTLPAMARKKTPRRTRKVAKSTRARPWRQTRMHRKSGGKLRELYPEIEPYASGHLRVSELHEIYYEECGNPRGQPALFVHGG